MGIKRKNKNIKYIGSYNSRSISNGIQVNFHKEDELKKCMIEIMNLYIYWFKF